MIPATIVPFNPDSYLHFVWYRCSDCGHTGSFPAHLSLQTSTLACPHCQSTLVRDPTSEICVRFMSNWFLTDRR